jgi:hypothetical protein
MRLECNHEINNQYFTSEDYVLATMADPSLYFCCPECKVPLNPAFKIGNETVLDIIIRTAGCFSPKVITDHISKLNVDDLNRALLMRSPNGQLPLYNAAQETDFNVFAELVSRANFYTLIMTFGHNDGRLQETAKQRSPETYFFVKLVEVFVAISNAASDKHVSRESREFTNRQAAIIEFGQLLMDFMPKCNVETLMASLGNARFLPTPIFDDLISYMYDYPESIEQFQVAFLAFEDFLAKRQQLFPTEEFAIASDLRNALHHNDGEYTCRTKVAGAASADTYSLGFFDTLRTKATDSV